MKKKIIRVLLLLCLITGFMYIQEVVYASEWAEEQPEQPVEDTYYYENMEPLMAREEASLHDVAMEVGDRKKLLINKDSSKIIEVSHGWEGSTNYKFSKFNVEAYTSTDSSVVKITRPGGEKYPFLTAMAPGTAVVEVLYSYSHEEWKAYYKARATITVTEAIHKNTGMFPVTMMRGESVTYTQVLAERTNTYVDANGQVITETKAPESVTWTSSAPAIVSVKGGLVTGRLQGTAAITLKYKYAFSDGTVTCSDKVSVTSNCYWPEGNTIYFQPSVLEDEDAAPAINAALEYAALHATDEMPFTVMFQEGVYKLASATVRIYSNTTLDLRAGATLSFAGVGGAKESRPLLKLGINGSYEGEKDYNASARCAGYGGFRNIHILGGTIESNQWNRSTHIVMAHATNVSLIGTRITGGAGMHMMEIAAIDGFTMENCVLDNFVGSKAISGDESTGRVACKKNPGNYEALQFDVAASAECFGGIYMDGTPMKNIKITGCTFDGVPRGIGIHTQVLGSYHDTADISYNTFLNTTKEAIHLLAFKNCTINYNIIEDCGAGIVVRSFADNGTYVMTKVFECSEEYDGEVEYDFNIEVIGNEMTILDKRQAKETVGILLYGRKIKSSYKSYRPGNGKHWGTIEEDNYSIGNIRVEDNRITTAGVGIHFSDATECVVKNNIITGGNYLSTGIFSGIYASEYSCVDEISGNEVLSVQGHGISVAASSSVIGIIENNTVKKAKYHALKLENATEPLLVKNNSFHTRGKKYSVVFIATGKGNENDVVLMGNTISAAKGNTENGILLVSGSCTMKKNTISRVKTGICVENEDCIYVAKGNRFQSGVEKKKKTP